MQCFIVDGIVNRTTVNPLNPVCAWLFVPHQCSQLGLDPPTPHRRTTHNGPVVTSHPRRRVGTHTLTLTLTLTLAHRRCADDVTPGSLAFHRQP